MSALSRFDSKEILSSIMYIFLLGKSKTRSGRWDAGRMCEGIVESVENRYLGKSAYI